MWWACSTDTLNPAARRILMGPEARYNFFSRSRSMQVVEILSVRVLHTLAQKLGAGVSFSLQGKPELAADHPAAGPHGADRNL